MNLNSFLLLVLLIPLCFATTSATDCKSAPVDVVFLLDSSDSLGNDNFTALKQFIKDVTNAFLIGPYNVQISVVSFSSKVRNEFNLNTYHTNSQLFDAIDRISYIQETKHTALAIQYVRTHSFEASAGDRPNAPNILILLTDGHSSDTSKTLAEARRIKNKNVTVIVVGVGKERSEQDLHQVASTSGNVLTVQSFDSLPSFTGRLQQLFCTVDGGWSQFGPYSACTKTCGSGGQFRIRSCSNPRQAGGGRPCPGPTVELRQCNNKKCPGHTFIRRAILDNTVPVGVSQYGNLAICTKSCGGGWKTKACTNHNTTGGDRPCDGGPHEVEQCNTQPCPNTEDTIDGGWSQFGNFSICTKSCGGGWKTQYRNCTNPRPLGDCKGNAFNLQPCNNQPCANMTGTVINSTDTTTTKTPSMDTLIDREPASTSTIPSVASSMYTTAKASTRTAESTAFVAKLAGSAHVGRTSTTSTASRNVKTAGITNIGVTASGATLTVDGGLSQYGNLDFCTKSCGGGWKTKVRTCTNPSPTGGGLDCNGTAYVIQQCNNQPCPNTTTIVITSTDTIHVPAKTPSMDTSFNRDSASTSTIPSVASYMDTTTKASTIPADSTALGAKLAGSTHVGGTSTTPTASRRAETTEVTPIGQTDSGATLSGSASIGTLKTSTTPMSAASAGITSIGETALLALLQSSAPGIGTLATPTASKGVTPPGITQIGKTASGATFAGITPVVGTFSKFPISRSAASAGIASIGMTASGASPQRNAHFISTPKAKTTSMDAAPAAAITFAGVLNPGASSQRSLHEIGDSTAPTTSMNVTPAGISFIGATASGYSSESSVPVIGTSTTSPESSGVASSGLTSTGVAATGVLSQSSSTVIGTLTTPSASSGAAFSGISSTVVIAPGNKANIIGTSTTPTASSGAAASGISSTVVTASGNKAHVIGTSTTSTASSSSAASGISSTVVSASGNKAPVIGTSTTTTASSGAAASGISSTVVTALGNKTHVIATSTTSTASSGSAASGISSTVVTASGNKAPVIGTSTTTTASSGAAASGISFTGVTASGNKAPVIGTSTTPTASSGAAASAISSNIVTASGNKVPVIGTSTTTTAPSGAAASGILPNIVTASGNQAHVIGTLGTPTTLTHSTTTPSIMNTKSAGKISYDTIRHVPSSITTSLPLPSATIATKYTGPLTSEKTSINYLGAGSNAMDSTSSVYHSTSSKYIGASITTSGHSSKTPYKPINERPTFPEATHTDTEKKLNSETFAIIGLVTASSLLLLFLIVIIVRKIKRKWDKEHKNRQKANNKVAPLMMEDIEEVNMLRYSNFQSTSMFKGKAMPAVERGALDF